LQSETNQFHRTQREVDDECNVIPLWTQRAIN